MQVTDFWQVAVCHLLLNTSESFTSITVALIIGDMSLYTVASGVVGVGVVVVVAGICNRSHMRTSTCTCLVFGVSIGLDPG